MTWYGVDWWGFGRGGGTDVCKIARTGVALDECAKGFDTWSHVLPHHLAEHLLRLVQVVAASGFGFGQAAGQLDCHCLDTGTGQSTLTSPSACAWSQKTCTNTSKHYLTSFTPSPLHFNT